MCVDDRPFPMAVSRTKGRAGSNLNVTTIRYGIPDVKKIKPNTGLEKKNAPFNIDSKSRGRVTRVG